MEKSQNKIRLESLYLLLDMCMWNISFLDHINPNAMDISALFLLKQTVLNSNICFYLGNQDNENKYLAALQYLSRLILRWPAKYTLDYKIQPVVVQDMY